MKILLMVALCDLFLETPNWFRFGLSQSKTINKIMCFTITFLRLLICLVVVNVIVGGVTL